MGNWLDVAPVLAGILACTVIPLALLHADRSKGQNVSSKVDFRNSYWLTREVLLSGMGLCYLCGFSVSAIQHRALWGSLGLMPIDRNPHGRPTPVFEFFESLGWGYGDWQLELVSWVGVALSFQMMVGRARSCLVPATLWAMYLSIVNLQAPFTFSYGWEWLTCEVGFLVIFLCPLGSRGLAAWTPPPRMVLWLIRWCAFRLLLGAGMSKVGRNSSACWRDLSCTTTHYFTQPVPNPLSWYMHHMPEAFHKLEVALTFAEQLVLPFLMLVPLRCCRLLAGLLEIAFQIGVVGTGNYAWINFIGALPCIAMLDDEFLSLLHSRSYVQEVHEAAARSSLQSLAGRCTGIRRCGVRAYRGIRWSVHLALVAFMVYKSKDPIKELFGPAPWINNYDQWFFMNSQGVFGFINKHRVELVMRYTHDEQPGSPNAKWEPLDFKCLPGTLTRRPCLMSPYHYRLDWETWIRVTASGEQLWEHRAPAAAYHQRLPEFIQSLVVRLLSGDDDAAGLVGVPIGELYRGGDPPTAISVDFASYSFTASSDTSGAWWRSEPVGKQSMRAYGRDGHHLPSDQVRKSPRERHWVLGFCALGIGVALERAVAGPPSRAPASAAAAVLLAHTAALALASDYERAWPLAARLMPGASRLPACLQAGLHAQQRCCHGYVALEAGAAGLLALICGTDLLVRGRGVAGSPKIPKPRLSWLDIFIGCSFPAIASFAHAASRANASS